MPTGAPFKSQAQARAMHAAAEGHSNIGIPESVGKKLVAEGKHQKTGNLPQRVVKKAEGGYVPKRFNW